MNIKNIHLAYFSATFSTKRIVREIASQFQKPVIEYDITSDVLKDDVSLGSEGDLLIVGVPSYAGRVPEMAVRSLRRFLGNNTPAIIVSVYGNRAYDDTLIELKDLILLNREYCRHSIYHKTSYNESGGESKFPKEDEKILLLQSSCLANSSTFILAISSD